MLRGTFSILIVTQKVLLTENRSDITTRKLNLSVIIDLLCNAKAKKVVFHQISSK